MTQMLAATGLAAAEVVVVDAVAEEALAPTRTNANKVEAEHTSEENEADEVSELRHRCCRCCCCW